jgi:hypothetical protein
MKGCSAANMHVELPQSFLTPRGKNWLWRDGAHLYACLLQTAFHRADVLLQSPETYLPREEKEELRPPSS